MKRMCLSIIIAVIAITVAGASSYGYGGGSGEGTCGEGGVITGENLGNIDSYKTIEKDLIGGVPITYGFVSPEFSIYQVIITSKEDKCLVAVRLEHLKGTSKLAKVDAPGNVYAHENIWIGTRIVQDDVLARFRVKNSWMSDNGIVPNNVRLLQYDIKEGNWKQLDTSVVSTDDTYTYFESKVTGILIFAISRLKDNVIAEVPIMTPSPTSEETEVMPGPIGTTKAPGFEMAITMMAIFVIYIFRRIL